MATCLVALGSNLGDRPRALDRAVALLDGHERIRVLARSRWHETTPVGGPEGQSAYLNGAVLLETSLGPDKLLAQLRQVETALGRRRERRWAARTIDLDLLLYDELVIEGEDLIIPHPRMAFRRFVLEPAAEVASEMVHPTIGWTIGRLLAHLDTGPNYVAIAGPIAAGKTYLAGELHGRLGGRLLQQSFDAVDLDAFYADPAGLAWETEVRFLHERAAMLDQQAWSGPAESLLVSDFWFHQSLVYARLWLNADELARFEPIWREMAENVIEPKLLVVLEVPVGELAAWIAQQQLSMDRLDQWQAEFERILTQPGLGPILRLDGTQPDEALAEAEAAIRSIQLH